MPPEAQRKTGPGTLYDPLLLAGIGRLSLIARSVVEGVIAGLHRSPYRGFSLEFTSHRPYAPGDEIRRIDWKAYGRVDRYFVKEYEEETNLKAWVMVDSSASMGYGRGVTKLRFASLLACSLSYLLVRQRDSVGLATFRDGLLRVTPARSAFNHLEAIATELESTGPVGTTDTARAIEALASGLKRRGLIILISDLLDDPDRIALALKSLRHRKNDVIVLQVLDPDELDLPFSRQTLFLDPEGEAKVQTDPADIRADYQGILGAWLDRLRSLCHANQVDYELFSTGKPLDRALIRYLSRREARG
jgi:uncharacterized protein (DUF58 family)